MHTFMMAYPLFFHVWQTILGKDFNWSTFPLVQSCLGQATAFIIKYGSTIYTDNEGLDFLAQKSHLQTSQIFTVW